MVKFLKISIIIALFLVLSAGAGYMYFRDTIHDETTARLSGIISKFTARTVEIGDVGYVPFQTISLKKVKIVIPTEEGPKTVMIGKINITPNIFSLFKERRLITTVDITGLIYKDMYCDVSFRTISREAPVFREAFSIDLIDSLEVLSGHIKTPNAACKDIYGTMSIKGLYISQGKIFFNYKDRVYLISFVKLPAIPKGHAISLTTDHFALKSMVIEEDRVFFLKNIRALYNSSRFNMEGEVTDIFSPERKLRLHGTVEGTIEDVASLPFKLSDYIRASDVHGPIKAKADITITGPKIEQWELKADIQGENIISGKLRLDNLSTSLNISKGKLFLSPMEISLYGGHITGKLTADLTQDYTANLRFMKIAVSNIWIGHFLKDFDNNKNRITGKLNATIFLEKNEGAGIPINPLTTAKNGFSDFLKNLLMYSGSVQCDLEKAKIRDIRADKLSGTLFFKERSLNIPNIKGSLYHGKLESELKVELLATSLPYDFHVKLKNVDFSEILRDVSKEENDISGALNFEAALKGDIRSLRDSSGSGKAKIVKADLGPMPILAPLLGDLYVNFQQTFFPDEVLKISAASADFEISDRKITTDDLILWGEDLFIKSRGYMDFNGSLDFTFENRWRDSVSTGNSSLSDMIRTGLVNFGRSLGKARLTGTLNDQIWSFETSPNS